MKLSANNVDGWTGGRQFPLPSPLTPAALLPDFCFPPLTFVYSRFPPLLTPDSFPVPASPTPGSRHPNSQFPPLTPGFPIPSTPQFNTDLFYYPLEKLETNSHNHILQSLTMDAYLDIHKLTVPYSETDTVNSKLPAVT